MHLQALHHFEHTIPGFMSSPHALLHGIESRTSSPVRIDRDPATLECVSLRGLYPAGEGAGYAGGIVSAAVDGNRIGQAVVSALVQGAMAGTREVHSQVQHPHTVPGPSRAMNADLGTTDDVWHLTV